MQPLLQVFEGVGGVDGAPEELRTKAGRWDEHGSRDADLYT